MANRKKTDTDVTIIIPDYVVPAGKSAEDVAKDVAENVPKFLGVIGVPENQFEVTVVQRH
jgi:hypothetical protein